MRNQLCLILFLQTSLFHFFLLLFFSEFRSQLSTLEDLVARMPDCVIRELVWFYICLQARTWTVRERVRW